MRSRKLAIQTVDLNLFPVIQALYTTGNATLAGERLGMSQSAVSNALKRARERFDDPLFVRTSRGMMPTALAEQLIRPIEDGLAQFRDAIGQASRFDPSTTTRMFRLSLNDVGQSVILPRLVEAARKIAPAVRFETVELPPQLRQQEMNDTALDLVIGFRRPTGTGHFQQLLCRERLMVVMGASNALGMQPLTLDAYMTAEHIDYRASEGSHDRLYDFLRKVAPLRERRTAISAAYTDGLASVVANSNLLLTVADPVAVEMARTRNDLRVVALPPPLTEFRVSIRQHWTPQRQSDPAHQWLRRLVVAQFRGAGCQDA